MKTKFSPTLAHSINKKTPTYPAYAQPKLDGIRCYFTKDGAFSRKDNQFFNVQHLETQLEQFFGAYPDLILDGELYNHSLKNDFEKIVSLVKTQKPTDEFRKEAAKLVQYHIYDVFSPYEPDFNQTERNGVLDLLFNVGELASGQNLVQTPTFEVADEAEARLMKDDFKAQGYEGAMLRNIAGKYEMKRSHNLLKIKDFQDSEGIIIDVVEGKGKLQGAVGKFVMQFPDGKVFGAPMTSNSHVERRAAWVIKESFIGKTATVEYFELTKKGVPRFPIYKGVRDYE